MELKELLERAGLTPEDLLNDDGIRAIIERKAEQLALTDVRSQVEAVTDTWFENPFDRPIRVTFVIPAGGGRAANVSVALIRSKTESGGNGAAKRQAEWKSVAQELAKYFAGPPSALQYVQRFRDWIAKLAAERDLGNVEEIKRSTDAALVVAQQLLNMCEQVGR